MVSVSKRRFSTHKKLHSRRTKAESLALKGLMKIHGGPLKCTKCHHTYPRSFFYDTENTLTGKHSWCKACVKRSAKKSRKD